MSQALLAGTVMAMTESPAVAKASNLKVLAALAKTRIAALPDVPTMAELGFPAEAFSAGADCRPGQDADAAVARLEKACAEAVAAKATSPPVRGSMPARAICRRPSSRRCSRRTRVRNAEAVKKAGITQYIKATQEWFWIMPAQGS